MYFNIPGLRNSGNDHWQTLWEKQYPSNFIRINQENWTQPNCENWINQIEKILSQHDLENSILIGHSVGCAAIVNWCKKFQHKIKGALLVAPSDVERGDFPTYITGFIPLHLEPLQFPTIVVASTNDQVIDFERAEFFADIWGSELVTIQNGGHLEKNIGTNNWESGIKLLEKLKNNATS
ncbi:MAG: alpha/beta hydrolase [Saprospiraceae bacterium]|nr:alpha/beta hydrolase [Saprospiraceae bacterium]